MSTNDYHLPADGKPPKGAEYTGKTYAHNLSVYLWGPWRLLADQDHKVVNAVKDVR